MATPTARLISGSGSWSMSSGLKDFLCCLNRGDPSRTNKSVPRDFDDVDGPVKDVDAFDTSSVGKASEDGSVRRLSAGELGLGDSGKAGKRHGKKSAGVHTRTSAVLGAGDDLSGRGSRTSSRQSHVINRDIGDGQEASDEEYVNELNRQQQLQQEPNDLVATAAVRQQQQLPTASGQSLQQRVGHTDGSADAESLTVASDDGAIHRDDAVYDDTTADFDVVNDGAVTNDRRENDADFVIVDDDEAMTSGGLMTANLRDTQDQASVDIPPDADLAKNEKGEDVGPSSNPTATGLMPLSSCGSLRLSFRYDLKRQRMTAVVHEALELPSLDRSGASNVQVKLVLMPTKKFREKTKIKSGAKPVFEETFEFKVPDENLRELGLLLQLYNTERLKKRRLMGECFVSFSSLSLTPGEEKTIYATMSPRANLGLSGSDMDLSNTSSPEGSSSNLSIKHGGMPELMIGLAYNGTTGRLSVEVIKGSNFRNMAMNKPPDTSVKLTLLAPNSTELSHSKTSVRRGQPNPLYKETFMFQVAQFQLPDVSLMVAVYSLRSLKRKEMIGWFSLDALFEQLFSTHEWSRYQRLSTARSLSSRSFSVADSRKSPRFIIASLTFESYVVDAGRTNTSEEETAHWQQMLQSTGEQVCSWHVLLEP